MINALIMTLLFVTAVFLILLVLIQRGRGGGLAGAFGGLGGQSAFGTKAGDLFTRITIGVAAFWILLCALSVKLLSDNDAGRLDQSLGQKAALPLDSGVPGASTGKAAPATGSAAGKAAPTNPPATGESPPAAGQAAPAAGGGETKSDTK
ncbi:MAG TPA: preprotein translocase subunit SecG [Pirellulales bacterium]|jgi:preprotein translocase subunit SecG|nr:preprotein translocase subunit SecG [Pirellulales bacterium]